MSTVAPTPAGLPTVSAKINYAGEIHGPARFDHMDATRTNVAWDPVTVDIRDARPLRAELSLDREGFVLLDHDSVFTGAAHPRELADAYLAHTTELIRELTGARHVAPQSTWWNVLIRSTAPAAGPGKVTPGPGRFVHLDYTADDAYLFADEIRQASGGKIPADGRFVVYQAWEVLSEPPQDSLLALTDGRSVSLTGARPIEHVIGPSDVVGNVFASLLVDADPGHRWYYFSDPTPDELLLFVGFDSADPGRTNVAHTAFDVPAAGRRQRPRTSIESRYFAFFD
ncbi:CmcJ/NvfI family oxidoreductase [Parafrankia sp. EUN1f]|uniref:CmcJ/NvfI family oxidoreductase n=1 Tax=Parafrankia sp. EUN1f TaxID=102897 RepID=UPI0001C438ED|nr:CmcJ/NvfI family oxidoreductase [Parafrankia sp. EUN1f]EFC86871.1 conserved hypothetical protein [Parafrankia sp. EUN1f]